MELELEAMFKQKLNFSILGNFVPKMIKFMNFIKADFLEAITIVWAEFQLMFLSVAKCLSGLAVFTDNV